MTYSPWPKPVWRPTHQVSTGSPLYVCILKFITSRSSSCRRRSHTGCPSLSRIMHPSCPGPASSGPFFGATKTYPGAISGDVKFTSMTGGWRSGRDRKPHGCPNGDDEADALALGTESQPPSAINAAPPVAACRNLRRVILGFNSLPLSRPCPGFLPDFLALRKVHYFRPLFVRAMFRAKPPGHRVDFRGAFEAVGNILSAIRRQG